MFKFFSKLLDLNQKEVDRLEKIVVKINAFDTKAKTLKDGDFKNYSSMIEVGSGP